MSRLLIKDDDQILLIQNSSTGVSAIERHQSVINKNMTEKLLSSCFDIVFYHLSKHFQNLEGIESIEDDEEQKQGFSEDEEDEFNIPNHFSSKDESLEDEFSEDESSDDEISNRDTFKMTYKKGNPKGKLKEELKKGDKDKTQYGYKVIVKLLRLIEVFTSIAIRNDKIQDFVVRVTQSQQVLTLARLLVSCNSRHGLIILKIFENLINIKFDKGTFDKSFDKYKKSKIGKAVFDIEAKTKFDDCPFLQFLYNL